VKTVLSQIDFRQGLDIDDAAGLPPARAPAGTSLPRGVTEAGVAAARLPEARYRPESFQRSA
jgi:hypothetical protein